MNIFSVALYCNFYYIQFFIIVHYHNQNKFQFTRNIEKRTSILPPQLVYYFSR